MYFIQVIILIQTESDFPEINDQPFFFEVVNEIHHIFVGIFFIKIEYFLKIVVFELLFQILKLDFPGFAGEFIAGDFDLHSLFLKLILSFIEFTHSIGNGLKSQFRAPLKEMHFVNACKAVYLIASPCSVESRKTIILHSQSQGHLLEKILDIIDSIAYEKGLKIEDVKEAVKEAVIRTAQRTIDEHINYDVEIDDKNKTLSLFQKVLVCQDDDEKLETDPDNHTSLTEAREIDEDVEIGDEIRYELSLDNMSRTAFNSLHKNLEFQIQRLIENQLFSKYKAQVGQIISGSVVRVDEEENTYIEIDEIRAIMPKKNRIKGEKFKVGDVARGILRYVGIDRVQGIVIEISRTTPKYLEELLRLEVPEINDGDVTIEKSARIPGERAKIAISSLSPKIDPIGATVGVKGVRINAVSQELNGENIDCIEYSPIPEMFIARALSPAIITSVKLDENRAIVTIPSDQKPKAIGRAGINIRLASMVTGFEIELQEQGGKTEDKSKEEEKTAEEKKDISSLMSLFKE